MYIVDMYIHPTSHDPMAKGNGLVIMDNGLLVYVYYSHRATPAMPVCTPTQGYPSGAHLITPMAQDPHHSPC